jgi:DNA processing protein
MTRDVTDDLSGMRVAGEADEEARRARATLGWIAEPGDDRIGRAVDDLGAAEVLSLLRRDELPDGYRPRPSYRHRLAAVDTARVERDLERAHAGELRFVCPGDAEWPTQLDALGPKRPLALWLRGASDLRLASLRSVAIVGSRAASDYGTYVASDLGFGLGEQGWTVVSGAAYGIDAATHRGVLAAGGSTVAVLACGVDVSYPRGHESLLARIADEGVIVSELPPGTAPTRQRFLERNRVIAALTRGAVVIEAAVRSGALSTASWARELDRIVMGVPGPITSTMSAGVHRLLQQEHARLVCSVADVVELVGQLGRDLAPQQRGPERLRDTLDHAALAVLEAIPGRTGGDVSAVAAAAGIDVDEALSQLGSLLLLGLVERIEGRWRLSRRARASPTEQPRAGPVQPVDQSSAQQLAI